MNKTLLYVLLVQICLFIAITIFVFIFLKQTETSKLEKRFRKFSLTSKEEEPISLFDKIADSIWKFITKFSHLLNGSVVLSKYAKKYEKYITYEEKENKVGMDYITIKFMTAFLFGILCIVTFVFRYSKISGMSFLISFLIGFFVPDIILVIKFKQKRRQVEEDLLKAIMIMNTSFKSGRNIMQAISTVKNTLDGPIADEFKKIYLDITYGLSLEVVFERFYDRVKLEDAKYIASSLTLLSKTGGNIVRVFASIEKNFYYKKKLTQELNSMTAASIFVYRVLIALPIVFSLVIYVLNPTYFKPLWTSKLGFFFLVLILLLFILYIYVIKKVLKVKM